MNRKRHLLYIAVICMLLSSWYPVAAQSEGPVYVVQQGDTLFGIARRFGTTVDEILAINSIADSARIFPGTELTIPGFPGVSGVLEFTTVEFGETLETIALRYSIRESDLARLNRLVRANTLYAGQSLIVPEKGADEGPAGAAQLVERMETRLEMAARDQANPWIYHFSNGDMAPRWQMPGKVVINPAIDSESALFFEPLETLMIDPLPLVQGQTTVIRVKSATPVFLEGSLGEYELSFFPINDRELVALQGIHALADPGLRQFELNLLDSESGTPIYAFQQSILLELAGYGSTVLNGVPPETIDPAVTGPEEALIAEILAKRSPVKHWEGDFEYPSRYYTDEFVALFGTRRSYNNGALQYYHTGVDFYGNDVPIYAPAPGYVVLAEPLTVRGNATYIDHGWGVYSGYLHQSEIDVEVGEFVEAGDVIGKVGATGRVTGPHLHWEIWVGGVPVEPITWVERSFP